MADVVSRFVWILAIAGCAEAPLAPLHAPDASRPRRAVPAAQLAHAPAEPLAAEPEAEPEPTEIAIPTECATPGDELCVPPKDFVRELCKRSSTDLALVMFQKGTPWKRAYLRRDMEAWYAGAKLASPAPLRLDEEVIVIESRSSASGGLQIGPGSYDVIRWNGKCVSVMTDEVTHEKPPLIDVAEIAWRRLADETKDALLADPGVKLTQRLARDRCRSDRGAPRCEEATQALSRAIADYVRRGGDVPEPRLVMW